jgi:hypothetical protein
VHHIALLKYLACVHAHALVVDKLLIKADVDKGGYLTRKEFVKCMKDANLGFTRKEINAMMSEVDENQDGQITYNEFAPVCFSVLTEMVALRTMDSPQVQTYLRGLKLCA